MRKLQLLQTVKSIVMCHKPNSCHVTRNMFADLLSKELGQYGFRLSQSGDQVAVSVDNQSCHYRSPARVVMQKVPGL